MSYPRYPKYRESGVEWHHEKIIDHAGEYPVYSSQTEGSGIMGCLNSHAFSPIMKEVDDCLKRKAGYDRKR